MIQIFLEGNEEKFIDYLIRSTWPSDVLLDFATVTTNGWTTLRLIDNKFKENTDQGGKNLVIFDADTALNGGGATQRKQALEAKREELGIEFDIFLFPDNQSDGDFESLLERIINPTHSGLLGCFNNYEACLQLLNTGSEQILVTIQGMQQAAYIRYFRAYKAGQVIR